MEIATLNERLRDAFTPVLKHLALLERVRPPAPKIVALPAAPVVSAPGVNPSVGAPPPPSVAGSASSSSADAATPPAVAAPPARRGDARQYRAHCFTVLSRLNTYQYATRAAFARDLQQLEQLAATDDAVALLQSVLAGVKGRERPKSASPPAVLIHGLRFAYSGVPAIQPTPARAPSSPSSPGAEQTQTRWRCNLNVQDAVLTTGEGESPAAALAQYEALRRTLGQSAHGLQSLVERSAQRRAEQHREGERALRDALSVCIPRLAASTSVRVPDLVKPSGASAEERPPMVSSPTSSVSSSSRSTAASSSAGRAAGSWRNPKRKKPAHRLAFLRLRRLIQKKLCHHLRGQLVCVFSRPESAAKADAGAWEPTGRLEGGRVVVLATRKTVTFSEYVASELGRPASACAHMFLVRAKESIDDHLKVCDAFSEEDRAQLGHDLFGSVRNYLQVQGKRR